MKVKKINFKMRIKKWLNYKFMIMNQIKKLKLIKYVINHNFLIIELNKKLANKILLILANFDNNLTQKLNIFKNKHKKIKNIKKQM